MSRHLASPVLFLALTAAGHGASIYVDVSNCPNPGDGSIGDPYCSIQTAIDNAADTDEIEVAAGTYLEAINFNGKAVTLRSADGPEVTTIDGTGSFHVVQCVTGEGPETVLDGFTITGGHAVGRDDPDFKGGGMYNSGSSPTVRDCIFTGNFASADCGFSVCGGGGMCNNLAGGPTVTDCTFIGNDGGERGGGLLTAGSFTTVSGCTFIGNTSVRGGGMSCTSSGGAVVTDCVFMENTADNSGGGAYSAGASLTMEDCTFVANSAGFGGGLYASGATVVSCTFDHNTSGRGGGVYNGGAAIVDCLFIGNMGGDGGGLYNQGVGSVTGCVFTGNTSPGDGGGLAAAGSGSVAGCTFVGNTANRGGGMHTGFSTVTNCRFNGNQAAVSGGGLSILVGFPEEGPTITNCTFSDNSAAVGGGIRAGGIGSPTMVNCVLWGNSPSEILGTLVASYSNVQGGYPGTGNINADPRFVDPAGDDYRLAPGSPCIDTGDNDAVPAGVSADLDGNGRFVDDPYSPDGGNGDPPIVDMGAYEFQGACPWDCGDGDGEVGIIDFLALLAQWGRTGTPCDFDGTGVGINSFLDLLAAWGPCPPATSSPS